jgi:hypothetical protein
MTDRGFPSVSYPYLGDGLFEIFRHEADFVLGSSGGVADEKLLQRYCTALSRGHEILSRHLNRPSLSRPVRVNVFDVRAVLPGAPGGFSYLDEGGSPVICLPSGRSGAPTSSDLDHAACAVYHELTHAFNWSSRPPRGSDSLSWSWLDEALALLVEAKFCPTPSMIRPRQSPANAFPLTDPRSEQLAALFTSFLESQFEGGLEALFRLWDCASDCNDPIDAFGGEGFLSIFHSFAKSVFFDPLVFEPNLLPIREAITPEAIIWFKNGLLQHAFQGVLDHLSFHLYECVMDPFAGKDLLVILKSPKNEKLMASAIPVETAEDGHVRPGREYHLFGDDVDGLDPLAIPLTDGDGEPVMRVIIVISNCGIRGDDQLVLGPDGRQSIVSVHDDSVNYDLMLTLR